MKLVCTALGLLVAVVSSSLAADATATPASRPNIILIMADDFGYECVTANGGESYSTPHLDRLAANGLRFENCHVQPLCTPTRVQLMTGLFNIRNYLNFGTLVRTETTFAQQFKQGGMSQAFAANGNWGMNLMPRSTLVSMNPICGSTHVAPPRYANPGLEHNGRELDFSKGEYGPKLVNDFALDFITRHKSESFLLYYPMILTHDPFQPTPDSPDWDPMAMGEKVNRHEKHFAEMTAYMDQLIGKLDRHLSELGIRDNTLLIFVGDNGTGRGVTSRFQGKDYPGGKGTTTCRGTHVPLIVSWPAVIKQGRVSSNLISSVDFLPTICEAAGMSIPGRTDGVSFLPQLRGETGTPRQWLYHWYSPRQGTDLKVTEYAFTLDYKLYRDGRFFDLRTDPFEQQPLNVASLSDRAAQAARELRNVLAQFDNARPAALEPAAASSSAPQKPRRQRQAQ